MNASAQEQRFFKRDYVSQLVYGGRSDVTEYSVSVNFDATPRRLHWFKQLDLGFWFSYYGCLEAGRCLEEFWATQGAFIV